MEAELLEASPMDQNEESFDPKVIHVRALGFWGALLAFLTVIAAASVGILALFGTTIVASAGAWLLWPLIFNPDFTRFVFGSARVPFWKFFVMFLAAGALLKLVRRFLIRGH